MFHGEVKMATQPAIKKIILDMDGVIANFTDAAFEYHCKDRKCQIPGEYDIAKCLGITTEALWYGMDEYDFWVNAIKPYDKGLVFAFNLSQLAPVVIASIPYKNSMGFVGKVEWLKKHGFGAYPVLLGAKLHLAQPGYLLIDDCEKNVDEWLAGGGQAYLFPRPWNRRYAEVIDLNPTQIFDMAMSEVRELFLPVTEYKSVFDSPSPEVIRAIDRLTQKSDNTGEVREKDPTTGAEKGSKLARFDLIPEAPLWELAEHYGRGAQKYAERNYERGYKWSLSFAAAMRHLWAFWRGEDRDPETGTRHVICAAWHCLALALFAETHPEKDDRVKHG